MAKVDAAVDGNPVSSSAPPNHGMAQGPVEARSLSSVTTIASNPPAYPRNPTQKKLDPLELYIVRVPGSKGRWWLPSSPSVAKPIPTPHHRGRFLSLSSFELRAMK